jgi:hypothetical protein
MDNQPRRARRNAETLVAANTLRRARLRPPVSESIGPSGLEAALPQRAQKRRGRMAEHSYFRRPGLSRRTVGESQYQMVERSD